MRVVVVSHLYADPANRAKLRSLAGLGVSLAVAVPDRWAWVPMRTPPHGPGLIHWADRVKPWQRALTPERDRWRRYAAAFRAPPEA